MRTEMVLEALKRELQLNCGDMLAACKASGVSLIFVNQWRKDDIKVNEALTEAENVGVQGLVSAAIRRGVHGVEEDVYYKGLVVGQKINYSDGLLTTLLKAKVQEFAKDGESGGTSVTVNVGLMPRATNYDQWLEMKTSTLAATAIPLPAPDTPIEDAEFTAVPFAGIEL